MTVQEALRFGAKKLQHHRCPRISPQRESEELLSWTVRVSRETLFAHPEKNLTATQITKYKNVLARRLRHEPIEYLTGSAQFMGLTFAVTRDTLIPRPATEFVVEAALAVVKKIHAPLFIDVGTGSGCIAAALASRRPDAYTIATDTSSAALRIARRNANSLDLRHIRFEKADLLPRSLPSAETTIVVANLPYIPSGKMRTLAKEIIRYEPKSALDGGPDGLDPYRALLRRLPSKSFTLFCEILPNQYHPLTKSVRVHFPHAKITRVKNYSGVTVALSLSFRA